MMILYPRIPAWLSMFNLALAGVYVIASLAATLRRPLRSA